MNGRTAWSKRTSKMFILISRKLIRREFSSSKANRMALLIVINIIIIFYLLVLFRLYFRFSSGGVWKWKPPTVWNVNDLEWRLQAPRCQRLSNITHSQVNPFQRWLIQCMQQPNLANFEQILIASNNIRITTPVEIWWGNRNDPKIILRQRENNRRPHSAIKPYLTVNLCGVKFVMNCY